MNKLLIALILSIASTSYAATPAEIINDGTAIVNSENPQAQKQHNQTNKNSNKTKPETAYKTKLKNKGMHVQDETTIIKQNEPADAIEQKSSSPSLNQ